VLTF
jgi:hypothetical protein